MNTMNNLRGEFMKKILASFLAIVTLVTLTACGQAKEKINLEQTQKDIEAMKSTEISRVNIATYLSMSELFTDVTDKYDFDLKDMKISKANILEADGMYDFSFAVNTKEKVGYFIGMPAEGKKEALVKELNKFFKKYKYETTEVEGYVVYVACSDNAAALKNVEDYKYPALLAGLTYADAEMVLGEGTKDLVEEGIFALPSFMTSAEQYIIVKPSKGNKDKVEEKMNEYMKNLQTQWDAYLPDQAAKVKGRLETSIGDYLIYIVTSDNDAVLKTIKNNVSE